MPLDVQHTGPDGQTVDYVAMPMGIHARSQYMNYNHVDRPQHPDSHHVYVAEGAQYHSHYQDFEHYPSQADHYGNSTNPSGAQQGGAGSVAYLSEYVGGTNERSGTPQSPNEHSGSPSPMPLTSVAGQQHAIVQPVAYLQASHYDEMTDFRITPSPGGVQLDPRFVEDPAMVYGYVSAPTYGILPAGGVNPNATYATRPVIYDDNSNGTNFENALAPAGNALTGGRLLLESDHDLQKQLSQLSIHGHGLIDHNVATSPRGGADAFSSNVAGNEADQRQVMRWRDPNLSEVISFLNNPNNVIKANAAAYLQHLCYMDDPNKQRTRTLGGIPPLVRLLSHETPEVHRNACGALRNLSYGRQNDENKRAIRNANGIIALINLLRRTNESEVKELVTGVIWNMSSCEDLKRPIIDDGLNAIVTIIIKPHSGWDPINPGDTCWSTVFRNASGVLRNVSSAGEYARTKLRECESLVDSLLYVVRSAIEKSNIGNKIVENCVCILRNLSYRCQEVDDPNYDKHPMPSQSRASSAASSPKGENLGCFGASKKKKDSQEQKDNLSVGGSGTTSRNSIQRNEPAKGYELLWQPEVVQSYLSLLQSCSNPETLEAAAGAIQNLAACYWQPSIEIRAAVRKEKGLPILVELLRMEVDRVVCAVATALRNLAIDQRNKELIGKYAMRDLVQKLPSGNPQHDQGTSDDTIAAVLATINEVIKKNAEFSRSLLDAGGVERLMNITRQKQKYTACVLKFASQVLFTMWQHQELRDVYKKQGWKEQDFVTKTVAARNSAPHSPNNANNTLNRPMASQGRTRYEDRTIKRNTGGAAVGNESRNNGGLSVVHSGSGALYLRGEDIPIGEHAYQEGGGQAGASAGSHRMYHSMPSGNGPTHST
ncbi:catenin delta-2 isoform X3 [Condylostylus longicornis]|nr:catenin delta-2 isoform X3 [Condylostylus longicornis]XP_055381780.1 catenin delta-2 isoform X3 [Condylostylus longicornis]XP_055381781.1 catenin delta-2 isoform X3 [Condylostylus longicornis]XP_055381782.1 catenin delta-2 isoform X3 [Condylostylus longicornis]